MQTSQIAIENPYENINWQECDYVHSMSHQHSRHISLTENVCEAFYEMGYRHLAFSNYYPSNPDYPLPEEFLARHPEVLSAPNAEHHSYLDSNLHCNSLGSFFASGYGNELPLAELKAVPLTARFENLHIFSADEQPEKGVYRFDIIIAQKHLEAGESTFPAITIDGAVECNFQEGFAPVDKIEDRSLSAGTHRVYVRTTASEITATLSYDATRFEVKQFRLMQGTNRPWREVFQEILGQLKYSDGGGITLNHPSQEKEHYLPMLDFDPRVLGIEVWNQRETGFGFTKTPPGPRHFYHLWDEILRTGRRCFGFFVKDHRLFGRGRNVLLLSHSERGGGKEERERAALRAYRDGAFFGLIGALYTNAENEVVSPFDQSTFRFTQIELERTSDGRPVALHVSVTGQNITERPQTQIRFITANGIEQITDGADAVLSLDKKAEVLLEKKYIRIEAYAYPDTFTPEELREKHAEEIAWLHEKEARSGEIFFGKNERLPVPVPVTDMIFSQPLRILD